jgi:hypothetical protein
LKEKPAGFLLSEKTYVTAGGKAALAMRKSNGNNRKTVAEEQKNPNFFDPEALSS